LKLRNGLAADPISRRQVKAFLIFPTAAIPSSVGWACGQRCEGESESCAAFEMSFSFNGLEELSERLKQKLFQR
jgi:hypothetical protein